MTVEPRWDERFLSPYSASGEEGLLSGSIDRDISRSNDLANRVVVNETWFHKLRGMSNSDQNGSL